MPASLEQLIDDFALLDDWEERYRYIIELGRGLSPMDDALKTGTTKVSGCASQVWIYSQPTDTPEGRGLALTGDSDALIVKGLIAIAFLMFRPLTVQGIVDFDAGPAFAKLGLDEHLTPQRSNGFAAMIRRIKADARSAITA
jgi:cysteine desulfuration protein SufE